MLVGPVGAHVSINGGLPKAIDRAVKMGARCLQIFSSPPVQWAEPRQSEEAVGEFDSLRVERMVSPVFVHTNYLVNLASDKATLLEKSISAVATDLDFAGQIKAEGMILHLGSHLGRGYQAVREQLLMAIRKILAATTSEPRFIIENSAGQKGKIGSEIEEIDDLMDLLLDGLSKEGALRLGICLDTCHLWTAGYDLRDKKAVDELVETLAGKDLLDRVEVVHVNDSRDPLGSGRDRHANLGEGRIGLEGLRNFVTHKKLIHLPKIIETPGFADKGPDAENIEILKSILG